MKNDEKIDIKLSEGVAESELSQEEFFQVNYDTALRYINIAEHMKQFEDQDKYYHRAIQYLKKINDGGRYNDWMNDLRRLKFGARVEGKINLYEEASRIRDNAKSAQDYYSAQILFLRIAKYEEKHPIPEKWVTPENYKKALNCVDSAEQADRCEKLALALEASQRRKSLVASIIVILIILAGLAYTRTTSCRQVLAKVYEITGDYTGAYQKYNAVYERSGKTDMTAYANYQEARYKAAQKNAKDGNIVAAYDDFQAVAKDDYKDSRALLFAFEKENLKSDNVELGGMVHFASFDWRVLDIHEDNILLIKDKAIGDTPFNTTAGPCTWANSSIRTWLNTTFLDENFYEDEINAINDTEVIASENPYYQGSDPGENTIDQVFLLSVAEEEKYVDQLHPTETCWWLRTTGAVDGSAAFVYRDKEVMPYGYDVSNTEITVKPAIWISLK